MDVGSNCVIFKLCEVVFESFRVPEYLSVTSKAITLQNHWNKYAEYSNFRGVYFPNKNDVAEMSV